MMQTIRQQTAIRSPLVRQAARKLPRQPVAPLDYLIDGTAHTDDTLTYDTLIFPRTTRQAFGHYASTPAPRRITFLPRRGGLRWILVAVATLLLLIIGAMK